MSKRVINSKRGTSVIKEDVKVITTKVAKTVQPDKEEKPKGKS